MKRTFVAILASVFLLPWGTLSAKEAPPAAKPRVEVAFVLDSTGSMGGLIEGAKQKIWSIANGIVAQKPTPDVRIGLISYRDRGDEYVTKRFDLTDDIDSVFRNLQSFAAGGGGDGPESVNQALDEAVHKMSWSKDRQTLKIVFLVGDAPPHMDYADDVKYSATCQEAAKRDIIINTVQCGSEDATRTAWQEIARLSEGSYVALGQTGNMAAVSTPFDGEIARLSSELGNTVVAYGEKEEQAAVRGKLSAAGAAAPEAVADRASFNLAKGKRAIQGKGDLLSDISEKKADLSRIKKSELPPEMQKMTTEEQKAYLEKKNAERAALNRKLEEVSRKRSDYIAQQNKKGDSFDATVSKIIQAQAARPRKN
jgi:Mg-chelatase subunit ChlD